MATTQLAQQNPPTEDFILVDLGKSYAINPSKKPGAQLMSIFSALDEKTGNTVVWRFKNESGQEWTPKLPVKMLRTHPHLTNNLNAFKAYKQLYRPDLAIFDPKEDQQIELLKGDQEEEALNLIARFRAEGERGQDMLVNILRRLVGEVGDTTLDMVVLRLRRLAKQKPEAILAVPEDADFDLKVMLDKAIEAKRLRVQDNRFYKFPESDNLIADGEAAMILKIKNDTNLQVYLSNTPLQALVIPQPMTGRNRGQKEVASKPDFMATAEVQASAITNDNGSTDTDSELAYSDEQLKHIIEVAFASGYIESDAGGNYKLPGNTLVKTADEAMAFYKPNPSEAKKLEADLRSLSIPV